MKLISKKHTITILVPVLILVLLAARAINFGDTPVVMLMNADDVDSGIIANVTGEYYDVMDEYYDELEEILFRTNTSPLALIIKYETVQTILDARDKLHDHGVDISALELTREIRALMPSEYETYDLHDVIEEYLATTTTQTLDKR